MKLRKRIAPMIAGVIVGVVTITTTAAAHNSDYWGGKYKGKSDVDILLRISSSAQTDLLNWSDVYSGGFDWNNISSNASVRLAYSTPGMPQLSGEMLVVGERSDSMVFGLTIPYYSTGNVAVKGDDFDNNADWAYVRIVMNTNPAAYSGASNPSAAARMTFTHEVGHALKLCHPEKNSSISGHNISGLPSAIMNQGYPGDNNGATSGTITSHDKSCLRAKWGA